MVLNDLGGIVAASWESIPEHFPDFASDQFVVMPNHVHGVLVKTRTRGGGTQKGTWFARRAPTVEKFGRPRPGTLATVLRSFKSAATRKINETRGTPGKQVWQRNYYERIVRNEEEFNAIRQYILDKPKNWAKDEENPAHNDP